MSSAAHPLSLLTSSTPRDLGYGAVEYLKRVMAGDEPGGMITIQGGHMTPLLLRVVQ